jgi:hydroxypyruvate isomerase
VLSWSAHISMLWTERPYAERVGLARQAGFGWVETHWPAGEDADALAEAVAEHGVRVAALNTDGGDHAAGERGFLSDPRRRDEAQEAFLAAVDLATRIGARHVHVLLGREPGRRGWDAAVGMLRELVPEAQDRGLGVLVEALNPVDVPGYLTSSPDDVARLADDVGSEALRLLFDAYHLLMSGRDPMADAATFAELIGHVQVADAPGRGAPGTGRLQLWALVDQLDAVGYEGPIGLEYVPGGPTEPTLGFLREARDPAPFPSED